MKPRQRTQEYREMERMRQAGYEEAKRAEVIRQHIEAQKNQSWLSKAFRKARA